MHIYWQYPTFGCILNQKKDFMSISKEDVLYVANLAKLKLSDQEVTSYQKDLNKILEYMEQLDQIDTSDIAPLDHVMEQTATLRKDEAKAALPHENALKNAPDADSDYFRVPKVIE